MSHHVIKVACSFPPHQYPRTLVVLVPYEVMVPKVPTAPRCYWPMPNAHSSYAALALTQHHSQEQRNLELTLHRWAVHCCLGSSSSGPR